jgi:Leucine-rich repeat (LRR) protein
LSGYDITSFQKDTFKGLEKLEYLFVYDTSLKTLHPELFASQINLRHLQIIRNQIESLPPGIFAPLVNIGINSSSNGIEIRSSKLRRLNADSFGQHPHLQRINFSFNDINEIERGIFSKFHFNMISAGFYGNNCVSQYLSGEDLDNHEELEICFTNWEEIDPNNTTRAPTPTTTPSGCARNFNNFEIFVIIFVGALTIAF